MKQITILGFFLLFIFQTAWAQKTTWETLFAKADKQLAKGKFSGAISRAEGMSKTIRKKYASNDGYFAWIDLYAAKVMEQQAQYSPMENKIIGALDKLKKVKETDFDAYMTGFVKASDLYLEMGYLLKVTKILDFLNEELKAKPDKYWQAEVDLRQAIAQTYLENLNEIAPNLPKITQEWKDLSSTNQGKFGKLSSADGAYRKQMYARTLTLAGEWYNLRGDYQKADSALRKNDGTVASLAGSSNYLYIRHLAAIGDNFFDQDNLDQADRFYEKALSNASKKQKYYLQVLEKLTRTAILDKGDATVEKNLNGWYKFADYLTGEDASLYHTTEDLLSGERALFKKDYKDARKDLTKVIERQENIIPRNHPILLRAYDALYQTYIGDKETNYTLAEQMLKNALSLTQELYGETSLLHKYRLIRLADFYLTYSENFDKAKEILDKEPYKAIFEQRSDFHKHHLGMSNTIANYYDIIDKYREALDLMRRSTQVLKSKEGEKSLKYGLQLVKLAEVQLKVGDYKEAEVNMKTALKIIRKELSKNTVEYAEALSEMAKIYGIIGVYDEAEDMLGSSERIYKKLGVNDAVKKAKAVEEMAFLYLRLGKFAETEEVLNELITQKEKKYGKNSRQLINPLNQLGNLYLIKGDYNEAQKLVSKAQEIAQKVYGNKSLKTADSYALLSKYYSMIGDYERADEYIRQVIDIQRTNLGNNHVEVAKSLTDLAMIKFNENGKNAPDSEKLIVEAKKIIATNFDARHPLYAEILKNQGEIYVQTARYGEGFTILNEANSIWLEKLENRNLNSASVYTLLGDVYAKLKRFAEAKQNYEKAEEIYRKMLSKEHPDYIRTESRLGQLFFISGDYKEANRLIEKTTSAYLDFIKSYFPAMSEREKAKYWAKIQGDFEFFNSLAIKQLSSNPSLVEKMFNFRLITKGILLSTSQKVRQRILSSNDEELKNKYKEWLRKKEDLTSILALPEDQLAENNINPAQLRNEINQLEKELSEKSDVFADNVEVEALTWEDIQKLLAKDEAAIELIRFRKFENGFTDQIQYAALIITPETRRSPQVVVLENGNELENKFLNNYQNAIKFNRKDRYSYQQYWQPIVKELKPTTTKVYLSPDGVYHKLNLESFLVEDETYVIDQMSIRVITNVKDLLVAKKKPEKRKKRKGNQVVTTKEALLLGDPTFYVKNSGDKVAPLPGTEVEINNIVELLKNDTKYRWNLKVFTKKEANESIVKEMTNAPNIIHIATHGFFDDSKKAEDTELNLDKELLNDPLRKSGILATGAGDLLEQETGNYDSSDGIWTAYEAMSSNLDNTELVILSACETGTGKVEAGEGVYGLQRALLVAGADAIIVSLFRVNDEVTQKLMVKFYRNWLASGDKRKAFNDAQKEIKAEYGTPNYWGVFNMIGVN
ncbi:MAG: CHAT domain-containing protein [Microscillaceae bacterium]|jgi:CHAT domain-containing protein/Tfp pilus assembly protein PilF|nr:CHAT domain-containing protein [Microscillaceae bacterium]